ncbi:GNAT family N-acetyltransferase [soil metagenome]
MEVTIREASAADLPAILELYAQPDMDGGKRLSVAEAEVLFSRLQSYPSYKMYAAVADDRIVGVFSLLIMDKLAHLGTPSGIVEDVVVRQDLQGRGIGRKMMVFARDRCQEAGAYKLVLSSNRRREDAHRFYESLGFRKHGFSFVVEVE